MKKGLFFILFCNIFLNVNAKIKYDVNKYGVMFVYFVYIDSLPTLDVFKQDWESAINIAKANNKVKQIQFKNCQNEIFIWFNSSQYEKWEREYEKVIKDFPSKDIIEPIYGDSVLITHSVPAEYHSETYKNGKLTDTFVSDWSGGRMSPSQSTHTIGKDTYVTKTYVVPAHKRNEWERPIIGHKTIQKAKDLQKEKLKEIYKKI